VPAADVEFDFVVCGLALAHVLDLEAVFAELVRLLRPSGHLVTFDIHVASLYLGGVATGSGPDGRPALMPASRWPARDYLSGALGLGLRVLACAEPCWPDIPGAGAPLAQQWRPDAAKAAFTAAPAAIVWHFQR
jgi:SAM-dependent methyltransferase